MIKYKTIINKNSITLNLMGREKIFMKDQEVNEDAYTRAYPQYFKKIGEVTGYNIFLAAPVFIPDPIEEFTQREDIRKSLKQREVHEVQEVQEVQEVHEVDIDDIAQDTTEDVIFETEE